MARRVLITGITGFAGSHLAERLIDEGNEVHGIAHEAPPFPNLAALADRVTIHAADITDPAALRAALGRARPEVVFHLAGLAVPTQAAADPVAAVRVNVLGTALVARAAAESRARLVAASSADVYGVPDRIPVAEDAPLRPSNAYAATKVAAEAILRSSPGAVTILRPANQIGPRQHPGLAASAFAKQIAEAEAGVAEPVVRHGDLRSSRDFLDVRDMAAAYAKAGELDGSGVLNVGSGRAVLVSAILDVLMGMARVPVRDALDPDLVRGAPSALALDSRAFRERTGWEPRIDLERSLADTLEHWRSLIRANGRAGRRPA